jgi:hypothetical protein
MSKICIYWKQNKKTFYSNRLKDLFSIFRLLFRFSILVLKILGIISYSPYSLIKFNTNWNPLWIHTRAFSMFNLSSQNFECFESFTEYYQMWSPCLPNFSKFYQVLSNLTLFYHSLAPFTTFSTFYFVLPCFSRCCYI